MANFDQAAELNLLILSDDDDLRVFKSLGPELAQLVLRLKHNDPAVTDLELDAVGDLNESASRRLGYILGQNTHVITLRIWSCNMDIAGLCTGIQNNRSIQMLNFNGIDLQVEEKTISLAPFLLGNPSLKNITLCGCHLGPASINILSNVISIRSEDTLKYLNLAHNDFGDMDLDHLVVALIQYRNLRMLWLNYNGIGLSGCTSLAKLLKNQDSSLEHVYLDGNSVDNDCAIILADSLAHNTKLRVLSLRKSNGIANKGWSALLKLVCNSSSVKDVMESNHTLNDIGYLSAGYTKAMDRALGVDNANFFRACLRLNETSNKQMGKRSKIIWSHARGGLNLGESPIVAGAMPRILSWFGDNSNETNANLIQYHDPPLTKAKIDTIRLDSIFRILWSRPELCNKKVHEVKKSKQSIPNNLETCQNELLHCRADVERKADEIEDLRDEIKALCDENKRLKS